MNNTTNVILVVILVLIVGFGVWYVTMRNTAPAETNNGGGIELNVGGNADEGGNQQGY